MVNLLRFIKGYSVIEIDTEYMSIVNIFLYENKIFPVSKKRRGNYTILMCDRSQRDNILKIIHEQNIQVHKEKQRGIPILYDKYKKRPGVLGGIILLLFSLLVSRMFIWQINITGNDNTSREDTLSLLAEHGIYVGAFAPSLELREIYNQILIDNKDFCWISVNIRGTVANVEVRESQAPIKLTPDENKYANMIADYDGEITLVEAYAGQSLVRYGDHVRKGELLVSGLYEDKMGNTVAKYAHGKVFANIKRDFYIEIPLEYENKVYFGDKKRDFSLEIFSKTINILNNSGNFDLKYDIIEENEDICLFDRVKLPISYSLKTYLQYENQIFTRTPEQAKRIAYERLNKEISAFLGDGELLSKEIKEEISDGKFKLSISTSLSKNIAKIQEFSYNKG